MSPAMAPTFEPYDYLTRFVESHRGDGCHGIGNKLREEESTNARLAVKAIQTGDQDAATYYLDETARCRATRYEFAATGDALRDLNAERLHELRARTGRS